MLLRQRRGRPITANAFAAQHLAHCLAGRPIAHRFERGRLVDDVQLGLRRRHLEELRQARDPAAQILKQLLVVDGDRPVRARAVDELRGALHMVEERAVGVDAGHVAGERAGAMLVSEPVVLGGAAEVVQRVQAILRVPEHIDQTTPLPQRLGQQLAGQVGGEQPGPRLGHEVGESDPAEEAAGADASPLGVVRDFRVHPVWVDLPAATEITRELAHVALVVHAEDAVEDLVDPRRPGLHVRHHDDIVLLYLHLAEELRALGVVPLGHRDALVALRCRHWLR
mmetsp:Transcript_20068/g.57483  ORF Transcript_20068/g.57483 Transcript_20068/m.57483 type:complete len:282 (+) Transcript_20068:442-1287(+)